VPSGQTGLDTSVLITHWRNVVFTQGIGYIRQYSIILKVWLRKPSQN
jgi:hypothetical protein